MGRPTSHLEQQIRDEGPPSCLRCGDRGFTSPGYGKRERCPECSSDPPECRICGGYGYIEIDSLHDEECGECNGTGEAPRAAIPDDTPVPV